MTEAPAPHGRPRRLAGYAMALLAWAGFVLAMAWADEAPVEGALGLDRLVVLGFAALYSFAAIGKPGWNPTTGAWLRMWLGLAGLLAVTTLAAAALDGLVADGPGPDAAAFIAGGALAFGAVLALGQPRRPSTTARRKGIAYLGIIVAAWGGAVVCLWLGGYGDAFSLAVGIALAVAGGGVAMVLLRRNAADRRAGGGGPDRA